MQSVNACTDTLNHYLGNMEDWNGTIIMVMIFRNTYFD